MDISFVRRDRPSPEEAAVFCKVALVSDSPPSFGGNSQPDVRADIDQLRHDLAQLRHMHALVVSRVRILEAAEASRGGRVACGTARALGEEG
jgi:hypothetical protein